MRSDPQPTVAPPGPPDPGCGQGDSSAGVGDADEPTPTAGNDTESVVADTAPPTTTPEPERDAIDQVVYATFTDHDPCAPGERAATIEVRYVLQGDVAVGDELAVAIDDQTYRDGAADAAEPGSAEVFLFALSDDGGGRRVTAVVDGSGGQLSIDDFVLGVDRPGCATDTHDDRALAEIGTSDPGPLADPSAVVVAADVLMDFGVGSGPWPTRCANQTAPSHSALIVVRETYQGDIAPGTILVVTTYDTYLFLESAPSPPTDEGADAIIVLTPGAELPGIGAVEWGAVGLEAVDSGAPDRQAAWKRAAASSNGAAIPSQGSGTCGADEEGDPQWTLGDLPATGDVVVLATMTTQEPCASGTRSATVEVQWVAQGDVAVGDQLTVTVDDATFIDGSFAAAEGGSWIPFVVVADRDGDGLVASVAVTATTTDLAHWGFPVARPGCSTESPAEPTDADAPSAETLGSVAAVVVTDVLANLGTADHNPGAAWCPNGTSQSASVLVSVRESLAGDLAPGTVVMVTTYGTLDALSPQFNRSAPGWIMALTAGEQLPSVGNVDWAAQGVDGVEEATPQAIATWNEAIGGVGASTPGDSSTSTGP